MVNVTTQRPHSDTTTILNVGDHPFVQKPSVIFYADARIVDTRLLDAAVQRGAYAGHAAFQPAVIARIQAGVAASPFTPKKIKNGIRGFCCRWSHVIGLRLRVRARHSRATHEAGGFSTKRKYRGTDKEARSSPTSCCPARRFFEKSGTFTNGERRVQRVNEVIPPPAGAEAAGGNVLRSLRPGDALRRAGARPLFHARESAWCRDGRSRRAPA